MLHWSINPDYSTLLDGDDADARFTTQTIIMSLGALGLGKIVTEKEKGEAAWRYGLFQRLNGPLQSKWNEELGRSEDDPITEADIAPRMPIVTNWTFTPEPRLKWQARILKSWTPD